MVLRSAPVNLEGAAMNLIARCAAGIVILLALHSGAGAVAPSEGNAASLAGGPRVALVIGNADYRGQPLLNPLNDARAMADTLSSLGFRVIRLQNASQQQMFDAVRQFGDALEGGVGLFYFAGHGVQVKGRNFLVPVDADINREDEVPYKAFDVGIVLDKMEAAKNPLNVIILDACRNNPYARTARSANTGLAQMDAPAGSIIAFATAPGAEAADGARENGLYTSNLLRFISTPGLKVEDVFKRTRVAVKQQSQGRQIPWESTSLEGDFYFADPSSGSAAASTAHSAEEPNVWAMVVASNSARAYQAYLDRYPHGSHVPDARAWMRTANSTVPSGRSEGGSGMAESAASRSRPAQQYPASRSPGAFSFSAEEAKMDRATPEGRYETFRQTVAAAPCPAGRRNPRLRLALTESRGPGSGRFAAALSSLLRQAGITVASSGSAQYVLSGTVSSQVNMNRFMDLPELSSSAALTLATASGQPLATRVSREEAFAGLNVDDAFTRLVQAQASDIAAQVYQDVCER